MSILKLPSDEQLMLWVIDPTPLREIVGSSSDNIVELLYLYCSNNKCRWPSAEKIIVTDARYSYQYAREVIKSRFEMGESVISSSAFYSYHYARDVICSRFEMGEDIIASNEYYSYQYAHNVIGSRFDM